MARLNVTPAILDKAILKLKNGKGSPDGVTAEMFKALPAQAKHTLANFLSDSLRKLEFTEFWFNTFATLLPKIVGAADLSNYRPVASLPTIRKLLGYESYGLTLTLVADEEMQDANSNSRGVDKPTDILSFQMHECVTPGVLKKPQFDIPDLYHLGDILVDVPYVINFVNGVS